MNKEIIQEIFYEKELQLSKMKEDGLYIIEKIIKKVGDRYLINREIIQMNLIVGLIKII